MWFIRRAPDVELERFRGAWAGEHAERVAAHPGVRRYVQNLTLLGGYRRGEPRFDCVTELWLDEGVPADVERTLAEPTGLVDVDASLWFVADDVVMKDGAAEGVKAFAFGGPRPGISDDEYFHHWRHVHGPIGASHPTLTRYVQAHSRHGMVELDGLRVGGCAITWFPDVAAMRAAVGSPELAVIRDDETRFTVQDLATVITLEHVIAG